MTTIRIRNSICCCWTPTVCCLNGSTSHNTIDKEEILQYRLSLERGLWTPLRSSPETLYSMKPTENTYLRTPIKVLSYEVIHAPTDLEDESNSTGVSLAAIASDHSRKPLATRVLLNASVATFIILLLATLMTYTKTRPLIAPAPKEGAAWSAIAQPLSTVDPESLGFIAIDRPKVSMPGPIFGDLLLKNVPLPTNSWCENFFLGNSNTESMNRVFQLPYVIDTETHNGTTQGLDTHPAHVQANDRTVEVRSAVTLHIKFRAIERPLISNKVCVTTIKLLE